MNDIDSDQTVYAIRRSSQDKLTYKNIIAQAISQCNQTRGTVHFKEKVKALASTISFNVKGYNLAKDLDELHEKLEEGKKEYIEYNKKKLGRNFYYHANQAKFKIRLQEWYYNNYYEQILQILAAHNLLFDTEKYIKIKEVDQFEDQ